MTVKELIEKLKEFPEEAEVIEENWWTGISRVIDVSEYFDGPTVSLK